MDDRDPGAALWNDMHQLQQIYPTAGIAATQLGTDMKISEMMPSKYLKTSDLDEETVVTVKELKKVNVARDDADPEYKWTILFHEFPKPMVLNKTNLVRLGKALGDDTEGWIGNAVLLYVDEEVQYGAETVSGLRIKAVKHPAGKARAAVGVDDINRKLRDAEEDRPF